MINKILKKIFRFLNIFIYSLSFLLFWNITQRSSTIRGEIKDARFFGLLFIHNL